MPITKAKLTEQAFTVDRPVEGPIPFDHISFAESVVNNKEKYSKEFRAVCRRHIKEYQQVLDGKRTDIYFDESAPFEFLKFCWFFWTVVNTEDETVLFDPLDWQKFVSYLMLGWKVREDHHLHRLPGTRRYRKIYLITAKGSGKTPWVSALSMFMATSDKLPNGKFISNPRVYVLASTQEQASITMDYIEDSIEHSPILAQNYHVTQAQTSARHVRKESKHSRFPLISTFTYMGTRGLSGQTPSCNVIEELHEHPDNRGMVMLEKGIKRRQQPITIITTNAGDTTHGFAYEEHKYACDIATGKKKDDQYLAFIFQIDKNDDKDNPDVWIKANPSLGTTIRMDYLIGEYEKARRSPDLLRDFYRLNLGIWPDTDTVPFVGREVIESCESLAFPTEEELMEEWLLFLGLDLAPLRDLSSLGLCFAKPDLSKLHLRTKTYSAGGNLAEKEHKCNAPLQTWAKEGELVTTPGIALDYDVIVEDIAYALETYKVMGMAYDDYDINTFCRRLDAAKIDYGPNPSNDLVMINHPQGHRRESLNQRGLTMGGSINCFEARLLADPEPTISIEPSPLLHYAVSVAEIQLGQYGSRVFIKAKGGKHVFGYIDTIVASTMAVGYADTLGQDIPVLGKRKRQRFTSKTGGSEMFEALKGLGM